MKRIMTLTMMAFLFCLLSQLAVIRPAAAEDVWFYSFSDADVYFSTDSIQKGREYSNTIYTVRTATVKHSTAQGNYGGLMISMPSLMRMIGYTITR